MREGGDGEGTLVHWKLQATSKRVRDCLLEVTEPTDGELVEKDRNSSMVTTWRVTPAGEGTARVVVTTVWDGAGGIGGFFEKTFAPKGLARIYDDAAREARRRGREVTRATNNGAGRVERALHRCVSTGRTPSRTPEQFPDCHTSQPYAPVPWWVRHRSCGTVGRRGLAMDRGTDGGAASGGGAGNGAVVESVAAGRIPLAVVVVDREGLVSHWSRGARRLFGTSKEEAVGRPATDLLPVSGALTEDDEITPFGAYAAYDGLGPDLGSSLDGRLSYPAAGRARLSVPGPDRVDVLWWAYPLVGPGQERLLVLAADADGARRDDVDADGTGRDGADAVDGTVASAPVERIAPGFALHTDFPGAEDLARRLPEILPSMSVGESARIVGQVLELGYPILEFSQNERVPVTPDWGVPRRIERMARRERAARAAASGQSPLPEHPDFEDDGEDLEYAAVRERLEFLNEVSGRIGSSLDLSRTIVEVSKAVVPRFTDVAGTYLREQVVAGEGFPDGVPDTTTMWHRVGPGAHRRAGPLGRRRTGRRGHAVPGAHAVLPVHDHRRTRPRAAHQRADGPPDRRAVREARHPAPHHRPLHAGRAAQGPPCGPRLHDPAAPPGARRVQRHGPGHRRRTRRPRRARARQRPHVHVPGERRRDPPGQHAAAHRARVWRAATSPPAICRAPCSAGSAATGSTR